jgi:hypothetical protein
MRCPARRVSIASFLASAAVAALCVTGLAQGLQTGIGRTPTAEEIREWEAETTTTVAARDETIKGRLIDERCYAEDRSNTGLAHKGMSRTCAVECAKKGEPLAILTSDGKVYEISGMFVADNNAKLVPHLGHTLEMTGATMNHGQGRLMIDGTALKMLSK